MSPFMAKIGVSQKLTVVRTNLDEANIVADAISWDRKQASDLLFCLYKIARLIIGITSIECILRDRSW